MKTLKVAMLGFGNAGSAVGRLLADKHDEIMEKYDCDVKVTAIVTGKRGSVVDPEGIDLSKVCKAGATGAFPEDIRGLGAVSALDVVKNADYDLVCEMTPLNIFSGEPAITHIKEAFGRKKHVITANKGPIAWAYDELSQMAAENGCMFFYETVVMDGTPVFNLTEHTLKMCKVTEVSGILNSTTNYIIEELAKGRDYDSIMESGRRLGFVEADPAMDIEGYDAAAKVTALLNVLMKAGITPDMVERTGIENITADDIKKAASRGKVIKLLCSGKLEDDGRVTASVKPVEVEMGDMLASIDSTTSVVSITTDLMGKISVIEHAPEIEQTAYGVFGDIIRVVEGIQQ